MVLGMALSRWTGLSDGSRWYKGMGECGRLGCYQGERNLEREFDEEFWGFGEEERGVVIWGRWGCGY